MKSALLFEFLADKKMNTLTIRREFAANKDLVWDCYTKSELLNQWFAPSPFTTKTKSMEFSDGGHWHYAMVDPDGTEHWGYTTFVQIFPKDFYTSLDSFCDETGKVNSDLPSAEWIVRFNSHQNNTIVETVVSYKSLDDLEAIIKMGMEEGMKLTLAKLDELLLELN